MSSDPNFQSAVKSARPAPPQSPEDEFPPLDDDAFNIDITSRHLSRLAGGTQPGVSFCPTCGGPVKRGGAAARETCPACGSQIAIPGANDRKKPAIGNNSGHTPEEDRVPVRPRIAAGRCVPFAGDRIFHSVPERAARMADDFPGDTPAIPSHPSPHPASGDSGKWLWLMLGGFVSIVVIVALIVGPA